MSHYPRRPYPPVRVRFEDGAEVVLSGEILGQAEPPTARRRHLDPLGKLAEVAHRWRPDRRVLVEWPGGDAPGRPGFALIEILGPALGTP